MNNVATKHYKMYKSGKMWCLAAVTAFAVMGMHTASVSADTNDTKNNSSAVKTTLPNGNDNASTDTTSSSLSDIKKATSNNENQNKDDSTKVPASSTLSFNETDSSTAYLAKGTTLYKASTGTDVDSTINDNNVEVLRQKDAENGRVLIQVKSSKVIAYVDASALSDSPKVVNDDNGSSHYTRADMNAIPDAMKNTDNVAPVATDTNATSKNVPSAFVYDETLGRNVALNIGDSWPITNQDGSVADYHGYRLVIGLVSEETNSRFHPKMGLFAQKISDNSQDISTWQYIGYVFNSNSEGQTDPNDEYLNQQKEEWSGSSVMMNPNDTSIRIFYANCYDLQYYRQVIATAQVSIDPADGNDWNTGLVINHSKTTDHRTMFIGDNKEYAINNTDGLSLPKYPDNNTMRDPKYVVSNGQAYLTIEASTSYDSGNQGIDNFYNKAYFGMSDADFAKEQQRLLNEGNTLEHDAAYFANAALGLLKIDNNFNVTSVEKPLVTANAVSDEIERPNLFEYDGKWYLFATTRSWHMASDDSRINMGLNSGVLSFMIGFVSEDGIQGHYKPLNGNGLVVASDTPLDSATYAFLVLPNADKTKNQFVTTAYLGVRTFAPSFLLEINGDKTKVINNKVLNQGALVDDGVYFDAKPQTVVKTDNGNAVTPTPSNDDKPLTPQNGETLNGYLFDGSSQNGGYRWYQDNKLFTGFQFYMGAYYWFQDGVRQNNSWHEAWGHRYYTGDDGRAVQGIQNINGQNFDFGNDNTFYLRSSGYLYDGSSENGGYRWYENGELFTGFRYYAGTFYWFIDGVRQNAGWREAWGKTYYTDADGRAVQGIQLIDGKVYDFGNDNTYYSRPVNGYVYDGSEANGGYRWYENGELYTGFRYYTGTYYWFINGVRQNAGWREAWGYKYYTDVDGRAVQGWQKIDGVDYYFGDDNTYYLR
ncbi:glycoside hydrolase family 68 protein [Fructobacillus fructosus]|uniref:glycoside hydrolase family 68 protein n=1 Tax=Fructobacillus fructosus TaxID=1631 RepID=UPI002D992943|nr:Glucan-binding domain (YG repeat) [Fructobacillus fructosus]CAK1224349.1 Glucan-binding domain (YG repeat) [Fructobacillus fructosus]CAK1224537.1 Glucan-binding domain (YG repeat) [Fructobacillus fructosus]